MFCTRCGKTIPDEANFCAHCGQAVKSEGSPTVVVDDGMSVFIPRNGYALFSYYVGLFAFVFGILFGPMAIVAGIMGLIYAKKHAAAKGAVHAVVGIVCGTIALLLWLLVITAIMKIR
ncbi:MAG: zinc ribbon domain-containing protein [Lentisphaeria bacterium]|nr:zinc ribbon domain-containing protein [Lentisphaeria bacterium]